MEISVTNPYGKVWTAAEGRMELPAGDYTFLAVDGDTRAEGSLTVEGSSVVALTMPREDWLDALALGFGGQSARYRDTLKLDTAFDPADHSYTVNLVDTEHIPYVWVETEAERAAAIYDQIFSSSLYHGLEKTVELTSGKTTGEKLARFLMDENPHENTVAIRLSREADGVACYQDYVIDVRRQLTLEAMTAQCDGLAMTLVQPEGRTGFDPDTTE